MKSRLNAIQDQKEDSSKVNDVLIVKVGKILLLLWRDEGIAVDAKMDELNRKSRIVIY